MSINRPFHGSYRSGSAFACSITPAMDSTFTNNNVKHTHKYRWEEHYNNLLFRPKRPLPRPGMLRGKPVWYGGLMPAEALYDNILNGTEPDSNNMWVCDMNLEYELARERAVRMPTDKEYAKYFKAHIEKASYLVKQSELNDVVKVTYKEDR